MTSYLCRHCILRGNAQVRHKAYNVVHGHLAMLNFAKMAGLPFAKFVVLLLKYLQSRHVKRLQHSRCCQHNGTLRQA